jgi:hypothetical protein
MAEQEQSSGPRNALPITGQDIPDFPFETPLEGIDTRQCQFYDDVYFKVASKAVDPGIAALCKSLGHLCSFYPQYWNRAEPYGPAFSSLEGRSLIPDDLTESDIDTIEKLLPKARDPALRARLADTLWLRRKRAHQAARDATRDYITAAENLLLPDHKWVHAVELFHRALQIAEKLGRDKEEFRAAEAALLKALGHPLCETEPFFANHFLNLILALGLGEPKALADFAKAHADRATDDPERRRDYWTLEASFRERQGDESRAKEVRLLAAETYIEESELFAAQTPPSYFSASRSLAEGIEALRQASASPERISELRKRLVDYQKRSTSELKRIKVPVDTSQHEKIRKCSAEYVTNDDFRRSMILLALGHDIETVEGIRKITIEAINFAPFEHLVQETTIDTQGRMMAHKESLIGITGDAAEIELQKRMYEHAAKYSWPWRADKFIEPARRQIWRQHQPRLDNLFYLIWNNPFIPPGHEGIFLKGIFYGLAGDYLIASHLLAPQIENSIRYVLEQSGVDISNLNSDMTQQVKLLGILLEMPEALKLFGPDLIFELKGVLKEKHGYSFRNNVAHGFVSESDCYGPEAVNTWWLVLRLLHSTMILPEDMQ